MPDTKASNYTTTSSIADTLSFDDMKRAVEMLPRRPVPFVEKFEMCKKHWAKLEKKLEVREFDTKYGFYHYHYSGIPVVIRKYLKNVRAYYNDGHYELIKL